MVWAVIATLSGTALLVRIITHRDRPQIWWLAFTISLAAIFVGSAILSIELRLNLLTDIPNLSYLLSHLSLIVAGGAVQIYVHTLRWEVPSAGMMQFHAALAGSVALINTAGWISAPIHTVNYVPFRAAPLYPQALAYDVLFHLYLCIVLANVAIACAQRIRSAPADDPGRRVGLTIIGISAFLDSITHVLYLIGTIVQTQAGLTPVLAVTAAGDLLSAVAMTGITLGTLAFLVGPRLMGRYRARQLVAAVRPLWLRIRELHPSVALPTVRRIATRPELQAERMIVEINDGLRLTNLPPTREDASEPEIYRLIALALLEPGSDEGLPVPDILPHPESRKDEEQFMLTLARAYANAQEPSHAS